MGFSTAGLSTTSVLGFASLSEGRSASRSTWIVPEAKSIVTTPSVSGVVSSALTEPARSSPAMVTEPPIRVVRMPGREASSRAPSAVEMTPDEPSSRATAAWMSATPLLTAPTNPDTAGESTWSPTPAMP